VTNTAAQVHPLALKFKTERPVYPLRLTSIGNSACRVDLYVFGPGRASAAGFAVERCAIPSYPVETNRNLYRSLQGIPVQHPMLRRLVDQSPVATKLTARLSQDQMQKDAYLSWSATKEKQLTLYSTHAALVTAANAAVSLLVLALLAGYWA
jgi:hypothetical protein